MFTSWSEVSTPALLSMASVLILPPCSANSIRPSWVRPRLPPSPTTLTRRSAPSTRIGSLALSPTSAWVSVRRLHVRADAAVPQQVHRRLEDRLHQVGRGHLGDLALDAEGLADVRVDRDRLGGTGEDAAARGDQLGVVVGPAGARQFEDAAALGVGGGRVGLRVDEDVPVVEGGDQADVLGEQHAVAEHVTGHVADADDREVLGLGVDAQLAEVPLDGLPGAAGGDAHALVVVAGRAAGGEGVAEPEVVRLGDPVGDVREGRGALVGGDDEVGVVLVVPDDVGRRHDLAGHHVVGDVEQRRDERSCSWRCPRPATRPGPRPGRAAAWRRSRPWRRPAR